MNRIVNRKPYMRSCTLSKRRDALNLVVLTTFFIGNAKKVCSKKPGRGLFLRHMGRQLPHTWYS